MCFYFKWNAHYVMPINISQEGITCLKSKIETLEKGAKYAHS